MIQDPLPDRMEGLDSNDVLYAGDATYRPEAVAFARTIVETLVTLLQEVAEAAKTDGIARGNLIAATTAVLAHATALLEVDSGAVPAVELVCTLLKSVAPEHVVLKETITAVSKMLAAAAGRVAGGAAPVRGAAM